MAPAVAMFALGGTAASLLVPAVASELTAFGPVIAVLAQPLDSGVSGSFLEAWYVRWVEAHGARVVPLRYDAPDREVSDVLSRVNGVLFPGGGAPISVSEPYGRFGERVFAQATAARMPLWGTCLGFEQLMLLSSGEEHPGPLTPGWDSHTPPLFAPLNLTASLPPDATLLAGFPGELKASAASSPWTWHMHQKSVSIQDFMRRPRLQDMWHVLATNVDRRGKEFVSLVQAKGGLPIFASQFHPEKNANEWEVPADLPDLVNGTLPVHSSGAIEVSNRFAAFFVDQARRFRGFGFAAAEFWASSITRWPLRLAGETPGMDFLPPHMQVYYLPQSRPADVPAQVVV